MADPSESSLRRWPIDFHFGWMAVRALQSFYVIAFLKFVYIDQESGDWLSLVSSLIILGLILAFFHRFATGACDSEGIFYRRYFYENRVPWSDVREVQWHGGKLRFVLAKRNFLNRNLDFILNPFTTLPSYWSQALGGHSPTPAILERIKAFAMETSVGVRAPKQSGSLLRFVAISLILFHRTLSHGYHSTQILERTVAPSALFVVLDEGKDIEAGKFCAAV
jgi:hypothetical protein